MPFSMSLTFQESEIEMFLLRLGLIFGFMMIREIYVELVGPRWFHPVKMRKLKFHVGLGTRVQLQSWLNGCFEMWEIESGLHGDRFQQGPYVK